MIQQAIQRLIRRYKSRHEARGIARLSPLPIIRIPDTHQAAARALVDFSASGSLHVKKQRDRVDRSTSHPYIVDFYLAFDKELQRRGIPMYAHSFYRTKDEQEALYARGVTKARFGKSPHNFGCAVDIVHSSRSWDLTRKEWAVIGAIGKEVARRRGIKLYWGGDWRFYDPAHWELLDWKDYRDRRWTLSDWHSYLRNKRTI